MTKTTDLPHDPYITAVIDALTTAGLEPNDWWTSDTELNHYKDGPDAGVATMLNAVIRWDDNCSRDGLALLWDHPAEQWQYARLQPGRSNREPEFLPKLGRYSDPATVTDTARALLAEQPLPEGHAPYWHPADAVKTAVEAWAATDAEDDGQQPCGESGCICYQQGHPDHADCACGCDCPRYTNDIGQSVIVGNE